MSYMEKPAVMKKVYDFHKKVKKNHGCIGSIPRIIDLSYDNTCNFNCEHCFTRAPEGVNTIEHLSDSTVKCLADEAHELGFYEFDLQGGELLLNPENLYHLMDLIDTSRFYTYLTTNGYLLTEAIAYSLSEKGMDRISVSIDSILPDEHDKFRGCEGAHAHALQALQYAQKANIEPFMNITVGHYNAFSKEIEELLQYSLEHGYKTILNAAVPAGCWKGNVDVMLTEEDTAHIEELRRKYGNVVRDLWNPFDKQQQEVIGCNAGNILYITPWGDVLPCPFIHIGLGNIKEQSLKDIFEYTKTIKYFNHYSRKCLAGEDKEFVLKYLSGDMTTQHPADAKRLFSREDYDYGE